MNSSPENNSKDIGISKGTDKTLNKSIFSSSVWTMVGFGFSQVFRLGSNIFLAALLFEEAFALMAIVVAIIQGLGMFSDLGLSPSVVQNKRGQETRFLNTIWTIQIIRGVVLATCASLLAWPVAAFYAANDPIAWELKGLILVVAFGTFASGFQSTKIYTASRNLNIGRLTLLELSCQISGMLVSVFLAWKTQSIYALAFGAVTYNVLLSVLSHYVLPGSINRFCWDKPAVKEIIHFGKWIMISTIIAFFAMQIDKLVFSRLFPLAEIGVYAIAMNVAILAPMLIGTLLWSVAFPSFSRILDQGKSLQVAVTSMKDPVLIVGGYIIAGLVSCGQAFIETAYDDRYLAAGGFLAILAAGSWFAVIESIYGSALLAKGKAKWTAYTNAAKVVAFCLLLWPAIKYWGIYGAVFAVAASDIAKMVVSFVGANTIELYSRRSEIIYSLYWMGVSGVVYWISSIVKDYYDLTPPGLLIFQMVVTTLAFAPLLIRVVSKISTQYLGDRNNEN